MRVNVAERMEILEANKAKGTVRVRVIQAGMNKSGDRFYPVETLRRALPLYQGVKMYQNHATAEEEYTRPEGDLRSFVAVLSNVQEGVNELIGEAKIIDPAFREKVNLLAESGHLEQLGVSHNIIGMVTEDTHNAVRTLRVEEIVKVRSVDFVTEPGAYGYALALESGDKTDDLELCSIERLKERRPDLVTALITESEDSTMAATLEEVQRQLAAKEAETSTLAKAKEEAESRIKTLEEAAKVSQAAEAIRKMVYDSSLPEPAKEALVSRFKGAGSTDGVKEAIEAEKAYIDKLTTPGTPGTGVTGMGRSKEAGAGEEADKALRESFRKSFSRKGYSGDELNRRVELAAAGR